MQVEVRNDSVFISGYVNAVERLSKPIKSKGKLFLERIRAGAFRNALKRNTGVKVLLNHNENRVLATTADGNAVLEEDNIGLRAEITITDEEVVNKARQRKLSGWSFGFIANDDELSTEGNDEIRTITDLELLEVSILDDTKAPAYYGTSIEAREGGAKTVEIRTDAFTEGTENQAPPINLDELATLIAHKVIEVLKTEREAEEEELDAQAEGETEETAEPEQEERTEDNADEVTTEEQTEENTEEETEESRSIDYSSFEERLANLKK